MYLLTEFYRIVAQQEGRNDRNIKLEEIINDMTQQADIQKLTQNKDYLNTLLADATSIGQDDGFISGFHCATKLLISCLLEA
jgi:hypothetical protein